MSGISNAHVERLFSTLKVIKTRRRTRLQTTTLSDLLDIRVEGPLLISFSADEAHHAMVERVPNYSKD